MFDVTDKHFHELRITRGEKDAKGVSADIVDDAK